MSAIYGDPTLGSNMQFVITRLVVVDGYGSGGNGNSNGTDEFLLARDPIVVIGVVEKEGNCHRFKSNPFISPGRQLQAVPGEREPLERGALVLPPSLLPARRVHVADQAQHWRPLRLRARGRRVRPGQELLAHQGGGAVLRIHHRARAGPHSGHDARRGQG